MAALRDLKVLLGVLGDQQCTVLLVAACIAILSVMFIAVRGSATQVDAEANLWQINQIEAIEYVGSGYRPVDGPIHGKS